MRRSTWSRTTFVPKRLLTSMSSTAGGPPPATLAAVVSDRGSMPCCTSLLADTIRPGHQGSVMGVRSDRASDFGTSTRSRRSYQRMTDKDNMPTTK